MLKLPRPNIGKVSLLVAILVWLVLLFVDIVRIFGAVNQMDSGFSAEVSFVLEILFFITVYLFYSYSITNAEKSDFLSLIWRAASTGLIATAVSLAIRFLYLLLGEGKLATDPLLRNIFYHVNFAMTSLFLISTALLWKNLILYQKTKKVVQQWQAFEVLLLVSMFFIFFNRNSLDYSFLFGLVFLLIFSASLSVNLKWIPYLNFKEKWKSILFLSIILITGSYLFFQLLSYSDTDLIIVNLTDNLFLVSLFGFVIIYSLFSFLVTLFNLPTSSVFEQKLVEAINFQRLSQSIKPGQSETQVLDILIDSCMSASYADAGWIELFDPMLGQRFIHQRFIQTKERQQLFNNITESKPFADFNWENTHNDSLVFQGKINHPTYKSALMLPLVVNKETIGRLFLVKEVKDGFNKEMVNIISTFVGQASISVENHRLLNEAIKTERYKEELKIAQRVQRSLLPKTLHHDDTFEITGFSEAADEVGGDYYETKPLNENRFAVIIGDVSGKGTSAAFNMSQMKGIFHSLVQLHPSPTEFLVKANHALSLCLEKNHFITTSYCIIDTAKKQIQHSRAGHCPTLYFNAVNQKCDYLGVDGMGLGIVRTSMYEKFVEEKTLHYNSKDILVMFTDGIVEAKNSEGTEFGYERLKETLQLHADASAKDIQEKIKQALYQFVGKDSIADDDYSLMVIKFN